MGRQIRVGVPRASGEFLSPFSGSDGGMGLLLAMGHLGLLLAVLFYPILYHLASAGGYGFDILGFLRQTRGDVGGMLGGFGVEGWCGGWEGASVSNRKIAK